MITSPIPRRLDLHATPEEVAAALHHLPGFVWLDSSGRIPERDRDSALTILTAVPQRVITGHISDVQPLETALADLPQHPADWGFPTAGLFGYIEYEGHYRFAQSTNLLIYRHATAEWFECGDLLCHAVFSAGSRHWPGVHFSPLLDRETYLHMVRRAQDYITAGDIYQVNLAHPWTAPWPRQADPFTLYLRLREASPAPQAAYLHWSTHTILSTSPESFLRISGRSIRTRPIKGTRPRHPDPDADERIRQELLTSPKERAELVMITDLLRNDLGMICEYGTVKVTGLLEPERYEQVHHLVSTITGTLREDLSHPAALAQCFPGGSITGAPKKRATQIIAELEPHPRGVYTGALGYFGAGGETHFSIAIRTISLQNQAILHAGSGIVADSDPAAEWEETHQKARGILTAAASGTT